MSTKKKEPNTGNQSFLPVETATVSPPPTPGPSKSTKRNRKKQLKKKLRKAEIGNLGLPRSDGSSLYAFLTMGYDGYLLYRIDVIEHYRSRQKSSKLLPLLVFREDDLPLDFCTLVHMGSYLYFVGEESDQVYKLPKHKLQKLIPSEKNLGVNLLIPALPMHGPKRKPIVFVANRSLYVISVDYSCDDMHEFEKYFTSDHAKGSWMPLIPKPKGYGPLKSHLLLDKMVYFATSDETVLSFDLIDERWSVVCTGPKNPRTIYDRHPAFGAPVFTLGDMIVGSFYLDNHFIVSASPHSHCDESVKDSFMRPTLAPDDKFWVELNQRFKYVCHDEFQTSHYMVPLNSTSDDQNIICILSYGKCPLTFDPRTTYAVLTFFEIPGGRRETSVCVYDDDFDDFVPDEKATYYASQREGDMLRTSYFQSQFMHRILLTIKTTEHCTLGNFITCFSY